MTENYATNFNLIKTTPNIFFLETKTCMGNYNNQMKIQIHSVKKRKKRHFDL